MPDPLDRLQTAAQKIDALFGADYARVHPEVLVVVVQSAASDWAAAPFIGCKRLFLRCNLPDLLGYVGGGRAHISLQPCPKMANACPKDRGTKTLSRYPWTAGQSCSITECDRL